MAAAMRVIREPEKKPTELDVKILLGRCLDDFCEFYDMAGKQSRKEVLEAISRIAREMAETL